MDESPGGQNQADSGPLLSRVPRRIWLRVAAAAAVLVAGALVLRFTPLSEMLDQQRLMSWLESARSEPAAPLLFVLLFVAVSLSGVPVTPLVLAGGAVFGFLPGAALNFAGIFLGASATFLLARLLGYELVRRLLGERHQRFERLLGRRGFWSLVRLRYVPVPFFVANFGAALAGVRYSMFAATTALAFVPWMLVWSYFASALVEVGEDQRSGVIRNLVIAALVLIAISFVPARILALRRRGRYRQLLEKRRNNHRKTRASDGAA